MITSLEHVLDDVRTLLSYVLDIQLHPDVDGCRALSGERLARALNRLIPRRFDPERQLVAASLVAPLADLERLISAADDHLLLVLRAAVAYEHGMFALAQGQRDLAYILFIFVLECLAQARAVPEKVEWEAYPTGQRKALDRAMIEGKVPNEAAQRIREILCSTRHLRVTENFREFVVSMLSKEFFVAQDQVNAEHQGRRLRRSLMPRLLTEAYAVRSGYAHALAPIAEAVSAEWRDEFCLLRTGTPALTFRGLHRVVRQVMSNVLAERCVPVRRVTPPDVPGVVYRRASYQYWLYQKKPRPDGADAIHWMCTLLSLHVAFCTGSGRPDPPPHPFPVQTIASHTADATPERRYRPAMQALAWICGRAPTQPPRLSIEILIARVFVEGNCGPDVGAAAKVMKNLIGGSSNALLEFPPVVLIAVSLALARGFEAQGDRAAGLRWFERARDDAVHDGRLQSQLNDAVEREYAVRPHDLLFPRTTPGRLLEGFTEPPSEDS